MSAAPNITTWIIASVLALAGAAGAVLLLLGRGRRVGQEPYCRKCGYNLTGLTAERCPECGRPALGRNVVTGTRIRRWRLLATGAILLVFGFAGAGYIGINAARGVNWHAYLPTFALIKLARADDSAAIRELAKRTAASSAKPTAAIALVPLALQQQGARPAPPSAYAWMDLLAALEVAGHLTVPQVEQFHDQAVSFDIDFRRCVREGEDFTIVFKTDTSGVAGLKAECTIENAVVRIGDLIEKEFHVAGTADFSDGFGSVGLGMSVPITAVPPGTWPVRVHATKAFKRPEFTRDVELEYTLEILPGDAPEPIRLLNDDNIGRQLRNAITIKSADERLGEPPEPGIAYLDINVNGPVPVDLAFELLLRAGEREFKVSGITCKSSATKNSWMRTQPSLPAGERDGEFVIPVLRTNVDVARKTADMVEIWNGELVFPPVQLKVLAPAPSTAPSAEP